VYNKNITQRKIPAAANILKYFENFDSLFQSNIGTKVILIAKWKKAVKGAALKNPRFFYLWKVLISV